MKKFGIRITLSEDDPLRKPHLLGEDWESYRWYETEAERDRVFLELSQRHVYSRTGDIPRQVLTKVQR